MTQHRQHPTPHHDADHADHGDHDPGSDHAALLDLDAEVLHAYLSDLTAWLADLAGTRPVRRIADLGCGTGAGTFALLHRFPDAEVTAVDNSPELLGRLRDKADDLGLAGQVHTVRADLDVTRPGLDGADLVWASASLHHLTDPGRVLHEMRTALAPGALLAVVELDGFPWFLPHDLGIGRPGLEERCRAALAGRHAEAVPHLGADWGPLLSGAGFLVEAERSFAVELRPPHPAATGRYALILLRRMRAALADRIDDDDLAVLDTLVDSDGPHGLRQRGDLVVRAERTVWVARRPGR